MAEPIERMGKRWGEKIVLRKRTNDIHASLNGQPGIWGCGRSDREAIGDLVLSHPEKFGIQTIRE